MHQVRPDADHVQIQLGKQPDIVSQVRIRLAGNPDHHTAADLVAELPQLPQQGDAIRRFPRPRRMNPVVKLSVGSFETQ